MKAHELPEDQKVYKIQLSNKQEYEVTGTEKVKIMQSKSQFIELKTGEVINKSFIISISLDREETKIRFQIASHNGSIALPENVTTESKNDITQL